MKLTMNGIIVIEENPICIDVYLRSGFVEVKDAEEITYADMKRIAKENGINSHGMNKDALLEAIKEFI